MAKKTSFWPNFGLFGPNLSSKNFFHGFDPYYTLDILASYHCIQFQGKLMNQTWKNGKKTNFGPNFDPFSPNLSHQIFFSKIWLHQSLDIIVSYQYVQYQKKIMIKSWENLVMDERTDGRTDWKMDKRTDESGFIGCCPSNFEHIKIEQNFLYSANI